MAKGHLDIDLGNLLDPNAAAPDGTYSVTVTDIEETISKSGRPMLAITFEIVGDAEHAGKPIFEYWGLEGTDFWAKDGRYKLQEIALAAGLQRGDSYDDLRGKEVEVELEFVPADEKFTRDSNKIRRIYR